MEDGPWQYSPATDVGLAPLERFTSVRREPGLISWTLHHGATAALSAYFRLAHRMTIERRNLLPTKPPFVVIANHASHMDALILAAAIKRSARGCTYPIAAGDVFFETPISSVLSGLFINALPIWRKRVTRHALDDLRERLSHGDCGFILFPEGARSRDGKMLAFKSGVGRLVAGTNVPVVPCWIEGAFRALPPDRKWPRPSRIDVRVGEALHFDRVTNDRNGWDEVAVDLQSAVLALGDRTFSRGATNSRTPHS